MKSVWMSSRRAECYLWQQQESLAHHQVEASRHEATAQLTDSKEFREFRGLQPTPLITLVLSYTISTSAVCGTVQLTVLVCESLCAQVRTDNRYSAQLHFQTTLPAFTLKNPINIVCLIHWLWYIVKYALNSNKRYSSEKWFKCWKK